LDELLAAPSVALWAVRMAASLGENSAVKWDLKTGERLVETWVAVMAGNWVCQMAEYLADWTVAL
jgi:hypothetical protein